MATQQPRPTYTNCILEPIAKTLAIVSRRVITPDGERAAAVLVRDGWIVGLVESDNVPAGVVVEDVGNLVVMPGLVDTHVHINEPGRTEWEGFETATKAAAAGGITTLIEMPLNSTPVTTTPGALRKKLDAAAGRLWVDCGFYAGLVPGNTHDLQPLIDAGALGVKAFLVHSGIDDFPNVTEADLRAAMPIIAANGLPLLVHAELASGHPERSRGVSTVRVTGFDSAQPDDDSSHAYSSYLSSRPRQWEQAAIELMIRLCREFNCRTHIVHLSSSDAVPALRAARESGLPITVETCPHYLFFAAEEIADGDTRFKCAPPIREHRNRERLWQALKDGVIDFIVSDHSPCPPEMKCLTTGDFRKAWGGISSLQFGLSIVWTEARKRGFSVCDVSDWMSRRPAEFVGLKGRKGSIAPGYDADLVIWDPDATFTVTPSIIYHRHKVTPYEGRELRGKVVATIVGGSRVFGEGAFVGKKCAKILLGTPARPKQRAHQF